MSKTRVMIVDDHEVVRLGMRAAFELEADLAVVGEASNGVEALAKVPVQAPGSELTEREREVLALVARGYTNKQRAEALYVTEKTARNHVSHILEKLGLARRSEAAAFAVEHKLVPPREQKAGGK